MQIFFVEADSKTHKELLSSGWTTLSVLEVGKLRLARVVRGLSAPPALGWACKRWATCLGLGLALAILVPESCLSLAQDLH